MVEILNLLVMTSLTGFDALTARQREIAELLAKGLTNREIAEVLVISAATVRTHVTAILKVLQASNRTEVAGLIGGWAATGGELDQLMARPAIAVRPVEALAPDWVTQTLARGLASDLSALFARYCWFPVIADSARSPARDGMSGSVEIGRDLGARFVVGGNLRPGRAGWRLVAFVDDASSGERIWSESYDLQDAFLFEAQEQLVAELVAQVYPVLLNRAAPSGADLAALGMAPWLEAHRGMLQLGRRGLTATTKAREHFERARELDPGCVQAHFGLGLTTYYEMLNQWRPPDDARVELAEHMSRCVTLAPHSGQGYYLQARHAQSLSDHEAACDHLRQAIRRNPSMAKAYALLAQELALSDRGDEALDQMRYAERLGPHSYVAGLATVHFARVDYEACLKAATAAMANVPTYPYPFMLAAVSAWYLGDVAAAERLHRRMRTAHPNFHPTHFVKTFCPDRDVGSRILRATAVLGD